MKKENLNPQINKAIKEVAERIAKQFKSPQISNEEWLDKEEWRRTGRERMKERFFITNPNGIE